MPQIHREYPNELKAGAEHIVCPACGNKSTRQGAQDMCDVYVCDSNHLFRIKVGDPRKVWTEKTEKKEE